MTNISDDRIAEVGIQRHVLQVGRAFDHVGGRIDMRSGVKAHMRSAHDLAVPPSSYSLMTSTSNCMSFLNPSVGPHVEGARIEREADVDEFPGRQVRIHAVLVLNLLFQARF